MAAARCLQVCWSTEDRICPFAFAAVNCCSGALLLDHPEMNQDSGVRAVRAAACRRDVECLGLLLENVVTTPAALKELDVDEQRIIWYAYSAAVFLQ